MVGITGAVAAAAVAGVAGAFAQAGAPWLLLLAVAAPVAVVAAARQVSPGRAGVVATFLGWVLPVTILTLQRPEGDLVVAADLRGAVFLLVTVVSCGVLVALPVPARERGRGGVLR